MKSVRMVILCFSAFVVLAGGVLGYGLWRKGALSKEIRERVARADRILEGNQHDFIKLTSSEQKAALNEAGELKRVIESDLEAPARKADDLGDWISDRRALQAAVDRKRRELNKLDRALRNDFLRDPKETKAATDGHPCQQLSPPMAQRVRTAAQRAKEVGNDLTADIRGKRIDLSPVVAAAVKDLQSAADRAIGELQLREKAFRLFVEGMEQALAGRRVNEVRSRIHYLDEWFSCVVDAGEKQRRLREMEMKFAFVHRRGEMERILHARMDDLAGVLTNAKSPSVVRTALGQSQEVVRDAQALVSLFPDSKVKAKIPVLDKAAGGAQRWLQGLAGKAAADQGKQDIIDDRILYKIDGLTGPDIALPEWSKGAQPIRAAIEQVKKMDASAAFLEVLLDATKPQAKSAPPDPGEPVKVKWVGPKWEFFDTNVSGMNELLGHCLVHGKKRKSYRPVPTSYSAFVADKFTEVHVLVDQYLKAFEKFKKDHDARVARKQEDEDKKAEKKNAG